MEKKVLSDMDMPTILNRETGEYVPLFKDKSPVIKNAFSVSVSQNCKDYLKAAGINDLDLDNKEHIKLLYLRYYDEATEKACACGCKEDTPQAVGFLPEGVTEENYEEVMKEAEKDIPEMAKVVEEPAKEIVEEPEKSKAPTKAPRKGAGKKKK